MLTKEQIEANKKHFIELIQSLKESPLGKGADIDGLVDYLENKTDFFVAPASTKYHASYMGGLCEHSLRVYYSLDRMVCDFAAHVETQTNPILDEETKEPILDEDGSPMVAHKDVLIKHYPEEIIKVVGLLHDISKANYYEPTVVNKKVYSEEGTKTDELGKYEWVSTTSWKVKEADTRMLGSKAVNSFLIASSFLPLPSEAIFALMYQYAGMDKTESTEDIYNILHKYPLVTLLHLADMASSYLLESYE